MNICLHGNQLSTSAQCKSATLAKQMHRCTEEQTQAEYVHETKPEMMWKSETEGRARRRGGKREVKESESERASTLSLVLQICHRILHVQS